MSTPTPAQIEAARQVRAKLLLELSDSKFRGKLVTILDEHLAEYA